MFVLLSASLARASAGGKEQADTARRVMYVFAHQDDEVMIAARLKTDVAAGREVALVWITNGDKGGDPVIREKECRAAMAHLGVPEASLHYLGYEDQESYKKINEEYRETLKIARAARPEVIFSNAYEGGNIDHDVAHFVAAMVARALSPQPVHYEFPLYNSYKGTYQVAKFIPRAGVETLATPLDDALVALKLKMLDFYPSQQALFNVMGRLVNKKQLKKHGEPYRRTPDYDYLNPPTEGRLGYELGNNKIPHAFADFRSAVLDFYNSPDSPVKQPAERPTGK
jgi:LmbE family N-acetylglucosaminyl deacetylase